MKKDYLKPEAIALNVVCNTIIAASVGEDKPDIDAGANKNRGEWGNVWDK